MYVREVPSHSQLRRIRSLLTRTTSSPRQQPPLIVLSLLAVLLLSGTTTSLTAILSNTGMSRSSMIASTRSGRSLGCYPLKRRRPDFRSHLLPRWKNPTQYRTSCLFSTTNRRRKLEEEIRLASLPPPSPSEFPDWAYEPRDFFRFEILHESTRSSARVGRIHTPHGIVDTPGFVAVATNAALKGVDFRQASQAGQQLVFANTYHLLLHPGPDVVQEAGGIHKWTNHPSHPFITDSGGFQVFSLAYGSVHNELQAKGSEGELKRLKDRKQYSSPSTPQQSRTSHQESMVKVSEEGALFKSYRDGSRFLLTPETTVQAQKKIGADIIVPLDELPGYYVDRDRLVASVARTHRWEARSLQEHLKNVQQQAMYCVVHGGVDRELRTKSVDYLTSLPFDGYGIGGSLGNGREELKELLSWLMPLFEANERRNQKPRHLLGVADEESIRNAVARGVDTMDSCYPTRLGRHGTLLTRQGPVRIQSGKHSKSFGVKIDDKCECSTCQHYDRAYLWHLFKANEPLAITLATVHNIHYMNDLMRDLRHQIANNEI